MGAVEDVAVGAGNSLLTQGPIGILALFGWLCCVVLGLALIVIWRALRDSERARIKDLLDNAAASEKERDEQDRKMDRLQAVLEAKVRR